MVKLLPVFAVLAALFLFCMTATSARAQAPASDVLPYYLRDRGTGVSTSIFASYVRGGELLVYAFGEFESENRFEYSPADFGKSPDQTYFGRFRTWEAQMFFAYGVTDDFALEFESALHAWAWLQKSRRDSSSLPRTLTESGLGDTQVQANWRLVRESDWVPDIIATLEVVFPHDKDKGLIGTADYTASPGINLIKGFTWGTVNARVSYEYDHESGETNLGDYALEYVKRMNPAWRMYAGVEVEQAERAFILEVQYFLSDHTYLKLNNGFPLSREAPDVAPEFGIMMSF